MGNQLLRCGVPLESLDERDRRMLENIKAIEVRVGVMGSVIGQGYAHGRDIKA